MNLSFKYTARIGMDESGKGDYFGYLTVAAVCVNRNDQTELEKLNCRDSKKISDNRVLEIAKKIKNLCKFEVIKISPVKYNELYEEIRNINKILAWAHSRALENLLKRVNVELVIIDQFTKKSHFENSLFELGKQKKIVKFHGAESDMAVAAASIIARSEFLMSLKLLSDEFGIDFPKGHHRIMETGKNFLQKYSAARLKEVAKLHFKTTRKILS